MSRMLRNGVIAAIAALFVLSGGRIVTQAQAPADEIYVVTMNPTRLHGFHLDSGTQTFVEDDLDASSSGLALKTGVDSASLAVTDRFFLLGDNLTDVALSIVDAATGVELPRPTTATAGGQALVASADGQFSFESSLGPGGAWPPVLSVVDLRPSSPTLGREVAAVTLPVLPTATGGFSGDTETGFSAAVDSVGRLFLSLSENTTTGHQEQILTVDVSNPLAPMVTSAVTTITPDPPITALHVATIGGTEYLLAAQNDLEVYEVHSDGSLALVQTIASANPRYGPRTVRDAAYLNTPQGDRLIAVTDVLRPFAGGRDDLVEELVVFDMTPASSGFGTVLATTPLLTEPTPDVDKLALSDDRSTLFVLNPGVDSSVAGGPSRGSLLAFRTADVLAGNATSTVIRAIPGALATAPAMVVHAPVLPPAGLSVSSVAVDGTDGAVLVNDQTRTITVQGSGLAGAQHLFVGAVQATIQSASDTQITATVPPLIAAATSPVLAFGSGGSARGTVTIANSPTYLPGHVVYAAAFGGNEIAVLNAATKNEVASRFPTGQGPVVPLVSPDGKLLFVPDFRSSEIAVHSLIDDPVHGVAAGQQIASIPVGPSPFAMAINPAKPRLYVATSPRTIGIIDIDPNDTGTYLTMIDQIGSLGPGLDRALAVTPDGHYLYAAAQREPYLTVIDVSTDQPLASDITPVTLGLNERAGRTDGLAVSPDGTRLYFMTQHDQGLRIFDITTPTAPVQLDSITLPTLERTETNPGCALTSADVHTLAVAPDGSAVFIASRSRGCVDIFDTASNQFDTPIPTGTFSSDPTVTPDGQFVFIAVEQDDSVKTIDARRVVNGVPNPGLYRLIAVTQGGQGTTGEAISPGLVTPVGGDVSVQPLSGVTLTFDSVTAGGNTTVTSGNTSQLTLPAHFEIAGIPVYYDVTTSASFAGNVSACFPYDGTGLTPDQEANLRLLHEDNGVLVDVTTSLDTGNHTICGTVSHFSQFVVAQKVNHAPVASAGPDRTVSVGPACTAPVRLDGTASSDSDGDQLTFLWSGSFGTADGATPTVTLPLGKSTVGLTVTDPFGAMSSATTTITARDTTPPVIAGLSQSWPGRHRGGQGMTPVTFTVSMTENCDPNASCRITAISRQSGGSRHAHGHQPDWRLLGPLTALLRTDGDHNADDVYAVTITCTDNAGNTSTRTFTVIPRRR